MVSREADHTHLKSFRNGIYRLHMHMVWLQTQNIVEKTVGYQQKSGFFYSGLQCILKVLSFVNKAFETICSPELETLPQLSLSVSIL